MNNIYRHGDISFQPISKVEGQKVKHNGSFVLALGEHTGHKHVITTPSISDMEVFRDSMGGIYLRLKEDGTITHEEHRPIKIKKGTYKMFQEKEFDYALGETRKVLD